METKERYGRFVLQHEDARTSAGSFFRAVQLGGSGYEKHVFLFRSELLLPEVAQGVADGLRNGLQVQHAQVVRGFEAGRIDKTAFASYEMLGEPEFGFTRMLAPPKKPPSPPMNSSRAVRSAHCSSARRVRDIPLPPITLS